MPLFSRKRSLLSDVQAGKWRDDDERAGMVAELREISVKPEDVITLLWHREASVRSVGADKFLEGADAKSVMALVKASDGKPRHVKAYVQRLFARLPPALMASVIETLLQAKDPKQRRSAWDLALAMAGEKRSHYLRRATQEAPGSYRGPALQRLLQEDDPKSLQDLLIELAASDDARLAQMALQALAEQQGDAVVQVMLTAFGGKDATQREIAVTYMRTQAQLEPVAIRRKMLTLLSGGEDSTRRMSVEILLETGEPKQILEEVLIASRELVGWLRTRILETLQTFGDQVLQPALELLHHPDEQVRTGALILAEQFNDPRLVDPVCELLKDPDWWLRIIACETLGRLGDERAVGPLVLALSDEDTRWGAIDALAKIKSPKSLKPLTKLLRSDRMEVRRAVVRALGEFSDERLFPILQAVQQKDTSTEIRTLAAETERAMSVRLNLKSSTGEVASAVKSGALKTPVDRLLATVREMGASDLHLSVGEPPLLRVGGKLERLKLSALTQEQVRKGVLSTLNARQKEILKATGEVDYCYAIPEVGRYRANAFEQRLGLCATFRVIPNIPPTFADLRIPGRLTELLDYHQGIIVISGPAGSGKSTTLAAIINLINETKPEHILTIEDPVEFVHPVKNSLVNQREIGGHTDSFARALRGALRQDPDVIVVGELRDAEVTRMALSAAETGHLVIATMHTTSAVQTIDRLVTSFPPEEQQQVRMGLSESLKYVISQQLIPRKDGQGRLAIFEVLKGTPSIANLIRDNKTFQIQSMMQIGSHVGMQTVDMALVELYEANLITAETAWTKAQKQETFEPWCDPDFLAQAKSVALEKEPTQ